MSSIDAENVAKEVLETIGKNKKVVLGKIIKKHGYSDVTSKVPTTVTNTKSYKGVIEPFVKKMEKERDRLILALSNMDLSEEKYQTMIDGLDKLTKNIQLLSGGDTERISIPIEISETIAKKNDIDTLPK